MIGELAARFLLGGALVSLFSLAGDVIQPKSLAGIFGAAPSVAIATLALAFAAAPGAAGVALQGTAMIAGALALIVYCLLTAWLMRREGLPAWLAAGLSWAQWAAVAVGLYAVVWGAP